MILKTRVLVLNQNYEPINICNTKRAINLLGKEKSDGNIEPQQFSEDFSVMSKAKPGCFVLMGNGTKGSNGRPLHAADYDFNDELLVIGSSYWAELVEQQLK